MAWQAAARRAPGAAPATRRAAGAGGRPAATPRPSAVCRATRDRLLRYPDGTCRYIRYPVSETYDDDLLFDLDSDDISAAWDNSSAWDASSSPAALRGRQQHAAEQGAAQEEGGAAAGGSGAAGGGRSTEPAGPSMSDTVAYLDSLFGSSYAESQPKIDIEHCYKVLDGCPWIFPRPVYVLTLGELRPGDPLASAGGGGGAGGDGEGLVGSTYTLRTKVTQEGAADALAQLLGRPHLASSLDVAQMRDGVVTFEDSDAAARFATRLEEEGETQVTVAEVDSHKLFRLASDSSALVVLVEGGEGGELPAPFQLAAALKKQRAWDDM